MSNAVERTLEAVELIQIVKQDELDEVDKVLEKNGVLYNTESDIDYEKNYGDDPTEEVENEE